MAKLHEKILKLSLPLRYGEMLPKCGFKEMDAECSTGKIDGFWILWGVFKEHIKQNIYMAGLRKANSHSVLIQFSLQIVRKTDNVSSWKTDSNLNFSQAT